MWWLLRRWWPVLLMTVTLVVVTGSVRVCGVGAADAEVVEAAGVAQGEFAELVDGVVADAEVGAGLRLGWALGRAW